MHKVMRINLTKLLDFVGPMHCSTCTCRTIEIICLLFAFKVNAGRIRCQCNVHCTCINLFSPSVFSNIYILLFTVSIQNKLFCCENIEIDHTENFETWGILSGETENFDS